jgi:hypothetical protein
MNVITNCQICKKRPSTGIIFAMCDECFEEFERKVAAAPGEGYVPTDREVESINEPWIDRSKGN